MEKSSWVENQSYQLSSLPLETMVTEIHILKEGLKKIKTWRITKDIF